MEGMTCRSFESTCQQHERGNELGHGPHGVAYLRGVPLGGCCVWEWGTTVWSSSVGCIVARSMRGSVSMRLGRLR